MIQKTDGHYRNISIENNTKSMNARNRKGSPQPQCIAYFSI